MKSLFPGLRKRNRASSQDATFLQEGGKNMMKFHTASRSFDETSDNSEKYKSKGYFRSTTPRSWSDEVTTHLAQDVSLQYSSDSEGHASPSPDDFRRLGAAKTFAFDIERTGHRRRILKQQSKVEGPSPGSSPVQTTVEMVDQDDIITLTRHVRRFSDALNALRNTFAAEEDGGTPDEIQARAHNLLGEVLSILKGVLRRYPPLNSAEILNSAGIVIKKVKEHNYHVLEEPLGFFEATDQLALAFSSSVSDYLMGDQDGSQNLAQNQSEMGHVPSFDNLRNADAGYDDEEDKRGFSDGGESFEGHSERAESEESLDKEGEGSKRLSLNLDQNATSPRLETDHERFTKADLSLARAEELDRSLLSIAGSVDIALQRTKVWSKYAKDIITYMDRRAHIESDYCKQLAKLAHTTKAGITEESYLPFQSTYVAALECDINFATTCQKKLQQDLRGRIMEQLTSRRNDHDRVRSKLKERWHKECKKLNDSIMNLKKAKSMYVQKQQELERFVDKQEKEEGTQSSSVVPSFSIGKKKKEEDIAKRAEEAEDYYKKCVEDANVRQFEIEKTRENVLIELRQLVYQCDMTMRAVTCGYFQMMKFLSAPLPVQYQTLAEDSKQSEVGKQFAEFIKLQQETSKKSTCTRYSFELYVAEDRTDYNKGFLGPAAVGSPEAELNEQTESPAHRRRISTISAGSDTSLNRPSSPGVAPRRGTAWGAPTRNSNSDDTASVSSRSLPGSPSGSPTLSRRHDAKRASLVTEMERGELLKKEIPAPFKNLKLSLPALTHTFKKLRSSSKCKKCDSYVYFNGAECELCGLTSHKKCLETLALKCGKSRLPRKMTTFGVDFQKHLDATKRHDIPLIMEKCINEIDLRCLQMKGIYRVSGVKTKVEALSQQFETAGSVVDLQSTNPNLITSVLKLYLRELPEPLMTFDLYPEFIQIAKDSTGLKFSTAEDEEEEQNDENDSKCEDILRRLHECISKLPHANYYTVVRLFKHLRRVANNEVFNQMSCSNLAIIFGPTLLKPRGNSSSLSALMDMTHQVRVVELLIMNTQILDGDLERNKIIEEENEADVTQETLDTTDSKDAHKRSSSAQSDQDLGYNTQPDQLEDGKQELSLSDELQIDFPEIFRTDSDARDFASSFGSMDSVPDMPSPDVDDELKDLVERTRKGPTETRLLNGNNEAARQIASPQSVLSGSESNVSFGSASPVELPDSSVAIITDAANKCEGNIVEDLEPVGREKSGSYSRTRKKGHASVSSLSDQNEPSQKDSSSTDNIDGSVPKPLLEAGEKTNADAAIRTGKDKDVDVRENESKQEKICQSDADLVPSSKSPGRALTKVAPMVAPKPLSPISMTNRNSFVGLNDDVVERASTPKEDSNEMETNSSEKNNNAAISGNTRKLRAKFNVESDLDRTEKSKLWSGKDRDESPLREKLPLSRQSSEGSDKGKQSTGRRSTAKLVEKFTKETETRKGSRGSEENSPLTRRGVSVREILKQFESGDEMDDDESQIPRRRSAQGNDRDTRDEVTVKQGSLPREQKSGGSNKSEEKTRSVSDGTKREPKFV